MKKNKNEKEESEEKQKLELKSAQIMHRVKLFVLQNETISFAEKEYFISLI